MSVPSRDLADLLGKYEAIVRLRRHEEEAPVTAMRALARRFPGSLRELDEMPLTILESKLRELATLAVELSAELPPRLPDWASAQLRFHALVRGALVAKRFVREAPDASADHLKKWTDDPEAHAWASELGSIAKPPRGRLLDLVFARLAHELALEVDEVRRLVFTTTRPSRR
jgi:hypothetical protein